jgi:mannosyltransferase OCH1-like enzyme
MIPKIIHQIWINFGVKKDNPIPEMYKQWNLSWQEIHPDWEYILWDDEKIENLIEKTEYINLYNLCVYPVQKTDIARIVILYHYGGLYVDMDMECLRPFDNYIKNQMVITQTYLKLSQNCIIMSEKNNPILIEYLGAIKKNINSKKALPKILYILYTTGPLALHTVYFKNRKQIEIIHPSKISYEKTDSQDIIAIHYSQLTWLDSNPLLKWIDKFLNNLISNPVK